MKCPHCNKILVDTNESTLNSKNRDLLQELLKLLKSNSLTENGANRLKEISKELKEINNQLKILDGIKFYIN